MNSADHLNERIHAPEKLFSVSVTFNNSGVTLEPCNDHVTEVLGQLWEDSIRLVDAVPPIVSGYDLQKHAKTTSQQSVKDVLRSSGVFSQQTLQIREAISSQMGNAHRKCCETYEPFHDIHQFAQTWNEEAFVREKPRSDAIAGELKRVGDYRERLSKFRVQRQSGVVVVDGAELRLQLVAAVEGASTALAQLQAKMQQDRAAVVTVHSARQDEKGGYSLRFSMNSNAATTMRIGPEAEHLEDLLSVFVERLEVDIQYLQVILPDGRSVAKLPVRNAPLAELFFFPSRPSLLHSDSRSVATAESNPSVLRRSSTRTSPPKTDTWETSLAEEPEVD